MRTYKAQHVHYCGVDLHARTLFVNVLDHTGTQGLRTWIGLDCLQYVE